MQKKKVVSLSHKLYVEIKVQTSTISPRTLHQEMFTSLWVLYLTKCSAVTKSAVVLGQRKYNRVHKICIPGYGLKTRMKSDQEGVVRRRLKHVLLSLNPVYILHTDNNVVNKDTTTKPDEQSFVLRFKRQKFLFFQIML